MQGTWYLKGVCIMWFMVYGTHPLQLIFSCVSLAATCTPTDCTCAHTHTQKQLLQFATVGVLLCVLHMSYSSVFVSIAIQDASVQLLRHIAQYLGKW